MMAIPFGGLSTSMCQYDCFWYLRIATEGYGSQTGWGSYGSTLNWAFFPLYPMLLHASVWVIGMGPLFVGILLSNAIFVGLVLVCDAYLRRTRAVHDPLLWVVFALVFPFGFTFSAIYSEGLFALLSVAVLLALARRQPIVAGVLTALLCATRPTGVLMLPLIITDRLQHLYRGRGRADRVALLAETLLPIAVAPLGLALYMAFQYWQTGDAMAFNHVQIAWERVWHGPWAVLSAGILAWDWGFVLQPQGTPSHSYQAAWALLGLAAAGWMAWQRRYAEAWLCAASILLPAATALHSLPRFVASNPFVLFVLFDLVQRIRRPVTLSAVTGFAGLAHGVVLIGWFIAANALY